MSANLCSSFATRSRLRDCWYRESRWKRPGCVAFASRAANSESCFSSCSNVFANTHRCQAQVEAAVPGVRGLSFVDDISWWAEGADDREVPAKLTAAAAASIARAAGNGVAFDHGKTEAAFFRKGGERRRRHPWRRWQLAPAMSRSTRPLQGGSEYGSIRSSHSETTTPPG